MRIYFYERNALWIDKYYYESLKYFRSFTENKDFVLGASCIFKNGFSKDTNLYLISSEMLETSNLYVNMRKGILIHARISCTENINRIRVATVSSNHAREARAIYTKKLR